MNPIKKVWVVVMRFVSRGRWYRDPNAPIDFTKHKETLTGELAHFKPLLSTVRDEMEKAEEELRRIEAQIAARALKGKAKREALLRRKTLKEDIKACAKSQVDIEGNISSVEKDMRNITRYERAKPRDRSPEMDRDIAAISGRIRERRRTTEEAEDKAAVDDEHITEAVSLEEAIEDELAADEEEICERHDKEKADEARAAEKAKAPAEAPSTTPEPGYDVVNDEEDDEDPPATEPPQKQRKLDFS